MNDLISRQAAIDYFVTNVGFHDEDGYAIEDECELREIWTGYFDGIQSAQPKRGRWRHYEQVLKCSECGSEFYDEITEYFGDDVPHFCPNCGADMKEVTT